MRTWRVVFSAHAEDHLPASGTQRRGAGFSVARVGHDRPGSAATPRGEVATWAATAGSPTSSSSSPTRTACRCSPSPRKMRWPP